MADKTKQRLLEAREAIKVKQYDEARNLLKGINHPKAREWLTKIEKRSRKSKQGSHLFLVNGAAVIGAIIIILIAVLAHPPV